MSDSMVVFRVAKLKTLGNVAGAAAHNARLRPTPNAQPGGKFYELIDRGGKSVVDKVKEIHAEINELCKANKWYQRPDSVAAAEVIISASPEYFRPAEPDRYGYYEQEKLDAWLKAQVLWIKSEIGAEAEIVSLAVHLDEATPHIQVICVPRNHRGELSFRSVFGGENRGDKFSEWQTRAAEPVEHLGIKRGIKGSIAKHQKIKGYYSTVNKMPAEIPPITTRPPATLPEASLLEKLPFTASGAARRVAEEKNAQAMAVVQSERATQQRAMLTAFPIVYQQAKAAEAATRDKQQAERRTMAAEGRLESFKADALRVRYLDLAEVLTSMYGATEDVDSKPSYVSRKFTLADGRKVGITGDLWVEQGNKGGKQAINLVMHLENYVQADFSKAVRLLTDSFGSSKVVPEITRHSIAKIERGVEEINEGPVPAPESDPERWPRVQRWLTEKRGIPLKLAERAYQRGLAYADRIGNAVFVRQLGGAFLRGTGDKRFTRTIGRECGAYVVPGKTDAECWICESPIDALSIKAVYPDAHVIATGGNAVGPKLAATLVPPGAKVVRLAFDSDAAGAKMALQITPLLLVTPGRTVERALAPTGKDWNEAIIKRPALIHASWRDQGKGGTGPAPVQEKAPTGPDDEAEGDAELLPPPGQS